MLRQSRSAENFGRLCDLTLILARPRLLRRPDRLLIWPRNLKFVDDRFSIGYTVHFKQAPRRLQQQLVQLIVIQVVERVALSLRVASPQIREDFLEQPQRCGGLRVFLVQLRTSRMILQAIY